MIGRDGSAFAMMSFPGGKLNADFDFLGPDEGLDSFGVGLIVTRRCENMCCALALENNSHGSQDVDRQVLVSSTSEFHRPLFLLIEEQMGFGKGKAGAL